MFTPYHLLAFASLQPLLPCTITRTSLQSSAGTFRNPMSDMSAEFFCVSRIRFFSGVRGLLTDDALCAQSDEAAVRAAANVLGRAPSLSCARDAVHCRGLGVRCEGWLRSGSAVEAVDTAVGEKPKPPPATSSRRLEDGELRAKGWRGPGGDEPSAKGLRHDALSISMSLW